METSDSETNIDKNISSESADSIVSTVDETPSGVNGDKNVDSDENSMEVNKVDGGIMNENNKHEINDTVDSATPNRKRKLDEADNLSDGSGSHSPNFLGFPADTRTEEEIKAAAKKEREKPKLDLLVFDSSFGKGKRSRIPNKRYENLNIKSYSSRSSRHDDEVTSSEEGRNDDDQENIEDVSSSSASPRSKKPTHSIVVPYKKQRISSDMSNPNFKKPFEFGWRRELVYRSTMDSNFRRNGDVYYYTPVGKKIRSMRELSENMVTPELTLEDFTFWKEPVGINDPEREIIRESKMKGVNTPTFPRNKAKGKTVKEKPTPPPKIVASVETPPSKNSSKIQRLGGFKVKFPTSSRLSQGSKQNSKKSSAIENDMEIGMLPPSWSPKKGTTAKKGQETPTTTPTTTTTSVKGKRASLRKSTVATTPSSAAPVGRTDKENLFMQNYLQNLSYGYQTLLFVFQYLKVQDLLRAGCVCTLWRDIANHPSLWKTVRMKNSQVSNWEGLADALKKHNTENLDLRKMLLPNSSDDMWPLFSKAIARVDSLVRIELCRCPASVIEELAKSNKNLQVINAVTIRCEQIDLAPIDNVTNLQELRLKSTNGFTFTSDLASLKNLTNLKHLSLTSVKDLHKQNVQVIGELINLETLDLGECTDFPDNFGTDVIAQLTKLEKLRLEKGQGTCCTFNILEAVSKIETLEQLELVNFDVKAGFDEALGACTNIKKLLIIPTYISQSATTNHMVLGGVIKLKTTLSHFVWGVTLELLRVTELFVDQCEDNPSKEKKKPNSNGDSIPVLKPVPIMKTDGKEETTTKEPPQVEILPLPTLQKLLLNCLPTTRVKILKIPFHATWRQSIVDTVN